MAIDASRAMSGTARVFFALWPDEALRKKLHKASGLLHRAHGGRQMQPDSVHLTLLFIGALARERLAELQAAAANIQLPRFEIACDRADCWAHNHIAFLTASQPPVGLVDLVHTLEAQVAATGIDFDRRPHKPHITLVRNADCTKASQKPALPPILWAARDFVLVESNSNRDGASYSELARWRLL